MAVEVSRAEVADAAEILAVQKLAFVREAELNGDWSIPPLTQTLAEITPEFDTRVVLKACAGGRLVGTVRAWLEDGTCHIIRLAVHPDYQRRGIGAQLMQALEAEFADADRFELFTGAKSIGNIRFYERLGYRCCRTGKLTDRLEVVFMEKLRPRQETPR